MPLAQLLFSFRGRIQRGRFWAVFGCLVAAMFFSGILAAVLVPAFQSGPAGGFSIGIVVLLWYALVGWIWMAIQAKRWHDLGRSAWMVILGFIPLVCFVTLLYLGCSRGTEGENRFGPGGPPRPLY